MFMTEDIQFGRHIKTMRMFNHWMLHRFIHTTHNTGVTDVEDE